MKQWNFYFSGILYGIIRDQNEDGKELNHQTLDVFTNTFNREEPFHNDDFYEVLCRRKIRRFFESLPEYETHARAGEERFTTSKEMCIRDSVRCSHSNLPVKPARTQNGRI